MEDWFIFFFYFFVYFFFYFFFIKTWSILNDSIFITVKNYSVNTRRFIINIGFTSWKDLSLYVINLQHAPRAFF